MATYKTCRSCLGNGCIHCNHRGQRAERTFSRRDVTAAKLRRAIFGEGHSARFTASLTSFVRAH